MSVLPGFRRVPESTAKSWVGEEGQEEEVPAFMKQVAALTEYKRLSNASRYWSMSLYAFMVAFALSFAPYVKVTLGVALVLALFFTAKTAFSAARAQGRALKIDLEANRKMGIVETLLAPPKQEEVPSQDSETAPSKV